jgi:hypothetical protein
MDLDLFVSRLEQRDLETKDPDRRVSAADSWSQSWVGLPELDSGSPSRDSSSVKVCVKLGHVFSQGCWRGR